MFAISPLGELFLGGVHKLYLDGSYETIEFNTPASSVMKHLTLFLFCLATICGFAQQDIVVNGSGLPGTYSSISAAVQAANPGDKILVSNQAFPYQEDTLFIDRDLTIMPYSEITHIEFQGDISIALDSISKLTLIGFDSGGTNVLSELNDTSRTFLSEVNIIDCQFEELDFEHPKTSLYLSYSTADKVYFSHGDIIGNKIEDFLLFGCTDWSAANISYNYRAGLINQYTQNTLGDAYQPDACFLFERAMNFGNVEVFSNTCNIVANEFGAYSGSYARVILNSHEFAFNVKNNKFPNQGGHSQIMVYLCSQSGDVTNNIVNNDMQDNSGYGIRLNLAYCESFTPPFNFQEAVIKVLNNDGTGSRTRLDAPDNSDNSSSYYGNYGPQTLLFDGELLVAYNEGGASYENQLTDAFSEGPTNYNNNRPNPSPAHLNLDLTPNITGINGGSDAWSNYHPNSQAGFGTMTGSKARITYLNLPYQIFDPSNIQIKARAVHGN